MKTWKELATEALAVQDACNLSGVVHAFSRAITEVRELLRAEGREGTDTVNRHPVCLLYSSKIASLTYSESSSEFSAAYTWAQEAAAGRGAEAFAKSVTIIPEGKL